MKELLHAKGKVDVPLVHPGDIIFVPEKLVTWKKLIAIGRDISVFVTIYVLMTRKY